jgi:hypothetical protein
VDFAADIGNFFSEKVGALFSPDGTLAGIDYAKTMHDAFARMSRVRQPIHYRLDRECGLHFSALT